MAPLYTPTITQTPPPTQTPTKSTFIYEDELDDAVTVYVDVGKVEAIPREDSSIQLIINFPRADDLQSQVLADPYWVALVIFGNTDPLLPAEYGPFGWGLCQMMCWSMNNGVDCYWGIRQGDAYVPWEDVILPSFDAKSFNIVFTVPNQCQGLPWGLLFQTPLEFDTLGLEGPEPLLILPKLDF